MSRLIFTCQEFVYSIEDPKDDAMLNAALLEYTDIYVWPILLGDRILYAPEPQDRDELFKARSIRYKYFLEQNNTELKRLISTIQIEGTHDYTNTIGFCNN